MCVVGGPGSQWEDKRERAAARARERELLAVRPQHRAHTAQHLRHHQVCFLSLLVNHSHTYYSRLLIPILKVHVLSIFFEYSSHPK